jgi:riboflavin biosynthesis pyrimidine reductase
MPVRTLYEHAHPAKPVLPDDLARPYDGDLSFPDPPPRRPYIVGNFVQTVDGIVSLKIPGHSGGGDISGRNEDDAFIMGLLRAYADAVLIGEETFRVGHGHVWTADFIYPKLKDRFQAFRGKLGKDSAHPLNVVVSGMGTVDLDEALFTHREIRSVVLTTPRGKEKLHQKYGARLPADVRALPGDAVLDATDVATLLSQDYGVNFLLHEGGPTLFSAFLRKCLVDELFLTIAPQIVGRGASAERPNFSGPLSLNIDEALWGTLLSVKCAATGHVFLRYGWEGSKGA